MSVMDSWLEDTHDPSPDQPDTASKTESEEPGLDPYRGVALFQCARNGNEDVAKALLQDMYTCRYVINDEGLHLLHYAARYNHFNIIKLLVEKRADVWVTDDDGLTPLHYACRIKRKRKKTQKSEAPLKIDHDDIPPSPKNKPVHQPNIDPDASAIHYLITKMAKSYHKRSPLEEKDNNGCTPLHHAALRGDEVACEKLLMYAKGQAYETYVKKVVDATDHQKMTPLHIAACQCESDIARQLLKAGADVTKTDEDLSTPLHEAATSGDTRIAKFIFEACTKGDATCIDSSLLSQLLASKDEDGNTPLMLAVKSARYTFAVHCINKGASVNSTNKWHMSALHLAAITGDTKIVKLLLGNGARVNALNDEHQRPLHKAALFNNTAAMVLLLDNGALIEAKDKDDFTPLLLAACYGHAAAVELLIRRRADVVAKDKNDRTAVYLAAEEDKLEALEVLLKCPQLNKLINQCDENSNSPLHIAAGSGHISIVKCLLNNNADIHIKNDLEQTPIHMAALNGWIDTVREIVKREKNALSNGDEDSNTALHLAAMGGHVQLVQMLLTLGADPEVRNSDWRTPIGCAAAAGDTRTCKLLADHDARIDLKDKQNRSPLMTAACNGHVKVVKFLIEKNADVASRDNDGNNCLDLAIEHDHQHVALEIIKSNYWKSALMNFASDERNTPMRKLIRKMPDVAREVFTKCIIVKKNYEKKNETTVTYNYEFIDDLYWIPTWDKRTNNVNSNKDTGTSRWRLYGGFPEPYTEDLDTFTKNHPIIIMVDTSREELLNHPLIKSLIDYKWRMFGKCQFSLGFGFWVIFVLSLTTFICLTKAPFSIDKSNFASLEGSNDCQKYESDGAKHNTLAAVTQYIVLVQAFITVLTEVYRVIILKFNYFMDFDNWCKMVMIVTSILLMLNYETCQTVTGYRTDWQWNMGSIAVVLAWMNLVLYIQMFLEFGTYVVMFKSILTTFLMFFVVFGVFIIAFAMGFFCLLQNQTPFSTPWYSLIRTAVMMTGELEFTNILFGDDENHYWFTFIFFVVFLIVMPIITMNLLVGLAVNDIKGIQEQAELKRIAMKVHFILYSERALSKMLRFPFFFTKTYVQTYQSKENAVAATKEKFENQIQKDVQKILRKMDKIDNIKLRQKAFEADIAQIHQMLKTIMKAQNIKNDEDEE